MLSYRHGYHAGNHADILKHMTLCVLLRSLLQKDKPFTLIDTHAGAGMYDLSSTFAQKNVEYTTGLSKIINNPQLLKLVPEFYQVVTAANQNQRSSFKAQGSETKIDAEGSVDSEVRLFGNTGRIELDVDLDKLQQRLEAGQLLYPGSPFFEAYLSRRSDTVFLSDLHTSEFESLRELFKRQRKVHIELQDGLASLKALLPPIKKRGLILIDPSYEMKSDYRAVVKAVKEGHARFNQGIFAVWYPVLSRLQDHSKNLVQELRRLNLPLLQVELCVEAQQEDFGMCGSGMLIVNYPYQIEQTLEPIVGELYAKLCDPKNGGAKLMIINEKA